MKAAIPVAVGLAIANYSMAFLSEVPDYAHATQLTWYQLTAIFACWAVNKAFYEGRDSK
jgi:hypothetical protein